MNNLRNIVVKEENRGRIEEAVRIANGQSIDKGNGETNTIDAQAVYDAVAFFEKYFASIPKCFWDGMHATVNPNADETAEDYVVSTHFNVEYRCHCWHLVEAWRSGIPETKYTVFIPYKMMEKIERLVCECKFPKENDLCHIDEFEAKEEEK